MKKSHAKYSRNELLTRFPRIIPTGSTKSVPESLYDALQRIILCEDIVKVVVFGSYAYGEPTPDSDVDILVIIDDRASHKETLLKITRLFRPRLFPLNLILRTPDEINFSMENNDFFIKEIILRGVTIYEKAN